MIYLYDIFKEIADVDNGLAEGRVKFTMDNLMMAMCPGHPADLLDDLIFEIGEQLFVDPSANIELDKIKEFSKDLKRFRSAYKIKELAKPIKELKEYIEAREAEE